MGEEFLAAPPAAAYRWDQAFGPPDFRTFRVVALYERFGKLAVVPSSKEGLLPPIEPLMDATAGTSVVGRSNLALALLTRDPWEASWSIVDAKQVDASDVLAHMVTWADLRRELLGLPSPAAHEIAAFERVLTSLGHRTEREDSLGRANLRRAVAQTVKRFAAWTRGLV
jgi:hypothetical protein